MNESKEKRTIQQKFANGLGLGEYDNDSQTMNILFVLQIQKKNILETDTIFVTHSILPIPSTGRSKIVQKISSQNCCSLDPTTWDGP